MEEVINKNGRVCYIEEIGDESEMVMVKFRDSNIRKVAKLSDFRNGEVTDVVKASRKSPLDVRHVGEKRRQGDYWAELVYWDTVSKCRFFIKELDVVVEGSYKDFYNGNLIPKNDTDSGCVVLQKFMLNARLVHNIGGIAKVQFEDGTLCRTDLYTFLTGKVMLPGIVIEKPGIYKYGNHRVVDILYAEKSKKITINTMKGVIVYQGGGNEGKA
ncbi:MAG: hypothetical protein K2P14_01845 [Anaeroplasmataceae bacterium]|nr:hypothetical protein [Anaeroplasmataceae bacterium]